MRQLADWRFRLGLELSVLLHLVFLAMPARLPGVNPANLAPPKQEDPEEQPLRFELVELPQQREEHPSRPDAPGSDLSRRAHGGAGEKQDRPGVSGTSPELRIAPPSPGQGGATQASSLQPSPENGERGTSRGALTPSPRGEEGSAALMSPANPQTSPQTALRERAPTLRGLTPFSAPNLGVVADRKGGQVDLGPLSFDTQWYDWGPYAAEMLRRIRYHWSIPELAQLGVPGVVRIRFFIEKDGRVSGLTILKDSSHPPMDFAARDAILKASPLPPLPPEVGVEREGVIITFYYNQRPPEES